MTNNFKNALNALILLGFMVLAWATQREGYQVPIDMNLKINDDSTAFVLTNFEDAELHHTSIFLTRKRDSTHNDSLKASFFVLKNTDMPPKSTLILPFSRFASKNQMGKIDTFSKFFQPERFVYNGYLNKDGKKATGLFEFTF